MRILANEKIRALFDRIWLSMLAFSLASVSFMWLGLEERALYILLGALCMALTILASCYQYFREQSQMMEEATAQIKRYISGDKDARIECCENGELYKLFHEVNSLVAILNAHAEKEGNAKEFLRDTISDISHQLKTPLAALNVYNGILSEEAKDLPTVQEFVRLCEQELDRIGALVQNLLKITKFSAGTVVMDKKPEDVAEMMEGVKKSFSYRAAQEGKRLAMQGEAGVMLLCDRIWLTEAVGNIVKNALDHTKPGDFVCVEWKQFASIVQITVEDNGSGIHPEDLYHIFKRFYRSRFSKDTQGIGLGLPLAKSVIEAHGGTIEAHSELGVGTVFTVNFLVAQNRAGSSRRL